jgi:hypothetical protein
VLVCTARDLHNSLEWVDWLDEVAYVGLVGRAGSGYVRISRLGSLLLVTSPQARHFPAPEVLRGRGPVAVPVAQWESLRARFDELPPATALPAAVRSELQAAWQLEAPILGRHDSRSDLLALARARLLAADGAETDVAFRRLEAVSAWLSLDGDVPVAGELVAAAAEGARIETLYFDVPDTFDRPELREWRPYAVRGGRLSPAFRDGWMLAPAPVAG